MPMATSDRNRLGHRGDQDGARQGGLIARLGRTRHARRSCDFSSLTQFHGLFPSLRHLSGVSEGEGLR
jgi:hypothetical protein